MPTRSLRILTVVPALVVASMITSGCNRTLRVGTSDDLVVNSIKVQPFTRVDSFGDSEAPEGFGVWVQALDGFGDPVKMVGSVNFTLYSRRKASADPKGEQLVFWQRAIHTRSDQLDFWDRPSQMYHFELAWDTVPAAGDKYILSVMLNTPDDRHLSDEYEIDVSIPGLKEQLTGP
jgi:hypothetical protein